MKSYTIQRKKLGYENYNFNEDLFILSRVSRANSIAFMSCHVQSHEGSGDDRHLKKY